MSFSPTVFQDLIRRNTANFSARYLMSPDNGREATSVALGRRKDRIGNDERFRSEVENLPRGVQAEASKVAISVRTSRSYRDGHCELLFLILRHRIFLIGFNCHIYFCTGL
jgi:hypothetical protein